MSPDHHSEPLTSPPAYGGASLDRQRSEPMVIQNANNRGRAHSNSGGGFVGTPQFGMTPPFAGSYGSQQSTGSLSSFPKSSFKPPSFSPSTHEHQAHLVHHKVGSYSGGPRALSGGGSPSPLFPPRHDSSPAALRMSGFSLDPSASATHRPSSHAQHARPAPRPGAPGFRGDSDGK